jgi:hypothetical protein
MTKGSAFSWSEIEAAMARLKRGQGREGDFDLVQRAFRQAPAEYRRLKADVDSRVIADMRKGIG